MTENEAWCGLLCRGLLCRGLLCRGLLCCAVRWGAVRCCSVRCRAFAVLLPCRALLRSFLWLVFCPFFVSRTRE